MSSYISKNHCKFYLKIHLIFVCKYRKKLLEGKLDEDLKADTKNLESFFSKKSLLKKG
jgi:putative transposase